MAIYRPNQTQPSIIKQLLSRSFFVGALFLGAHYHDSIDRVVDNMFYHNIPVEKNYFSDARGWTVTLEINKNGKREYFLSYQDTKVPLTNRLVKKLEESCNEHLQVR